jgi:hypothetical protein
VLTSAPRAKKSVSEKTPAVRPLCTARTVLQRGQLCAVQRAGCGPRQLGAKVAEGAEKGAAAERVQRHENTGAAMFERPAELARGRKCADCHGDCADLRGAERGEEPFGAVCDEQRHAVSAPHPDREQRPREAIGGRLEIGVIQSLAAKNHGELERRCSGDLVEQIAEGFAMRPRHGVTHSGAGASHGMQQRLRGNAGRSAPRAPPHGYRSPASVRARRRRNRH